MDNEDEAYLEVPPEHIRAIAGPNTVWAQIGENGQLEIIRWDVIEMYALEFDMLKKSKQEASQQHTICKLLVLVRDQTRKECGRV